MTLIREINTKKSSKILLDFYLVYVSLDCVNLIYRVLKGSFIRYKNKK